MISLRPQSFRSAVFVMLQLVFIILIFITGVNYPANTALLTLYALFILLGIRSMYIMRFRFNISPEPFKEVNLVTKGPYKFIRHPMYTSVIGLTACLIVDDFSIARLTYWILLAAILILKLTYEEKLLADKFKDYGEYRRKSKRLIPFLY